jgi:quercetin dioxygenase-like cupin family protein
MRIVLRVKVLATVSIAAAWAMAAARAETTTDAADGGSQSIVKCVDAAAGGKHAGTGCFNLARASNLTFDEDAKVYWHLYMFPDEQSAQRARGDDGVVIKEYGRVWLSDFGPRDEQAPGGKSMATVGPIIVEPRKPYTAVFSYSVMKPGERTAVQTHSGPELWYVLAGQQCVETPDGVARATPGDTTVLQANVPMMLVATGTTERHAFTVVLHKAGDPRSVPADWPQSGACRPK